MIQVLAEVVLSMHVTPLNLSIIMYICSHHLSSLHCCITNNRMILNSYSEHDESSVSLFAVKAFVCRIRSPRGHRVYTLTPES